MPKYRLRTYEVVPPGGFTYAQTEGVSHRFATLPSIQAQAQAISKFRTANSLPRASVLEALEDVDSYTCARLGNMRRYCVASERGEIAPAMNSHTSPLLKPCRGCGAPVQ